MLRFMGRILMISTFFVGLGAITDTVWKTVSQNNTEFKKVIKIDQDVHFGQPIEGGKIVILRNVGKLEEF